MKLRLALSLVFLAALTRLFPHPPNFTALCAMGLFAGAHFQRDWRLFAAPFVAWFLTDLFLNNINYSGTLHGFTLFTPGVLWIYGGYALVILIGKAMLSQQRSLGNMLFASLFASVTFFVFSNISAWATYSFYPKTFAGLMACYTAGLPFLQNSIIGDLFFSAIMFGSYELIVRNHPLFSTSKAGE